jgi:5-methylthioadenosine/S-adenosylhomocysteine deaminase
MSEMIIRDCHALVPSETGPLTILFHQDIFIEGNKITAIQPTGANNPRPGVEVVEANQMLAIPGLINTHAHVPMVIFRGLAEDVSIERWFNEFMWPLENNLTPDDVYWGMMLGLVEMIEGGVTTVADHYFFMDHAARAVEQAGTRAALGWAVFADRGYDALAETADFVERWQGQAEGRVTTWMAPHAPYTCDDDFLKATVVHAQRLGVGIHIHASEEMGQTIASINKRGITPIQVLEQTGILEGQTLIAHGCGMLPEDIELLKNYSGNVGVAHAPENLSEVGDGINPNCRVAGGRDTGWTGYRRRG